MENPSKFHRKPPWESPKIGLGRIDYRRFTGGSSFSRVPWAHRRRSMNPTRNRHLRTVRSSSVLQLRLSLSILDSLSLDLSLGLSLFYYLSISLCASRFAEKEARKKEEGRRRSFGRKEEEKCYTRDFLPSPVHSFPAWQI
jgi:hypothetical protein